MGQGEEAKIRSEPHVEIQERGEIFFFYRPKVNKDEVHNLDDVQRLYVVLRPESGERPVEEKQDPKSGKEGAKKKSTRGLESGERPVEEKQDPKSDKEGAKRKSTRGPESGETPVKEKQDPKYGKEGAKKKSTRGPESGGRPVEEKQDPKSGKESAKKKSTRDPESGKEGAKKKSARGGSSGSGEKGTEGGHGRQKVNIEKQPLLRFIVMGRKSLPDPSEKGRPYWGFVEMVTTKIEDVKTALKGEEYDTSTRGHRHNPPARAVGEGIYRILRHTGKKMHTHLVYKLELPPEDEENEPQESLNIEREGSFVIQIKNPEQPGGSQFRGLQNKRRAVFPAHLQGQFGHQRYAPADPPDFLNYEGCEFLLISASDDIEEELRLELKTECEEPTPSCSDLVKTFGETASPAPLFEGTWV